jgi:hypothetical protein
MSQTICPTSTKTIGNLHYIQQNGLTFVFIELCHFTIKTRFIDDFGACNYIVFFFINNSSINACSHACLHAHIYLVIDYSYIVRSLATNLPACIKFLFNLQGKSTPTKINILHRHPCVY